MNSLSFTDLLAVLNPPKKFTMVFLDLDNTIIPTRLHQVLGAYMNIDIWSKFTAPLFKTLEESIISTIKRIRQTIEDQNQKVVVAVVSNADTIWIEQCLKVDSHQIRGGPIKLHLLSKFLKENGVQLFSAKDASLKFLNKKMGRKLANMMMTSIVSGTDENSEPKRWMLKYMAFGAIILKYRKQLGMGCARVISIGDGKDESLALREYAIEHKMDCIHFGFLKYPVIEQLQSQWTVLEKSFSKLISAQSETARTSTITGTKGNAHYFTLHEMSSMFNMAADNNRYFSGNQQLPSINTLVDQWAKRMTESTTELTEVLLAQRIQSICTTIRSRLAIVKQSKGKYLQAMVQYLVNHNELFLEVWVSVY